MSTKTLMNLIMKMILTKFFEEDLSMFRNENYEDEIRDKDVIYPDIEQSSGDEEEQTERMAKRGGGLDGALDDDEIDVEQQDDTYDGDQEVEKSEDEYQDTNEFDNEDDIDKKIEVDLSMFRNENYEDEIQSYNFFCPRDITNNIAWTRFSDNSLNMNNHGHVSYNLQTT
ncbi:hypothetical protein YC2023_098507 [Brassica napus]